MGLGVAYFVLFSVEAVVYLYKFAVARKVILKKISTISRSVSRRVPTVNKRKFNMEGVVGGGSGGVSGGNGADNGGYECNVVVGFTSGRTTTTVITNFAAVKNVEVDEP